MNDMSEEKKGGPYTKPQQEKRRKQVYEMYFEKGRSAASIARELGVNRNTVSEDVRFLSSEITSEYKKEKVEDMVSEQMERFDLQRERLMYMLESADNSEKLRIEKMILDMDCKLFALIATFGMAVRNFRK